MMPNIPVHQSWRWSLDAIPKAKEVKENKNKWDNIKLKSVCRGTINKMKTEVGNGENIGNPHV